MVKARQPGMVCEHCKTPIIEGERITVFAGRPWLTAHLLEYQKARLHGRRRP